MRFFGFRPVTDCLAFALAFAFSVGLLACSGQPDEIGGGTEGTPSAGASAPTKTERGYSCRFCEPSCSQTVYTHATYVMPAATEITYAMTGAGGGGSLTGTSGQSGATVTGSFTVDAGESFSVYVGGGGGAGGFAGQGAGGGGGAGYYGGGGGAFVSGGGGGSSAIVGPGGVLAYASGGSGGQPGAEFGFGGGGGGSNVGGAAGAMAPAVGYIVPTSGAFEQGGNAAAYNNPGSTVDPVTYPGRGGYSTFGGASGADTGAGGGGLGSGGGAGVGSCSSSTGCQGGAGGSSGLAGGVATGGSGVPGLGSSGATTPGAGGAAAGADAGAGGGTAGTVVLMWDAPSCTVCPTNDIIVDGVCTPCPPYEIPIGNVCTPLT